MTDRKSALQPKDRLVKGRQVEVSYVGRRVVQRRSRATGQMVDTEELQYQWKQTQGGRGRSEETVRLDWLGPDQNEGIELRFLYEIRPPLRGLPPVIQLGLLRPSETFEKTVHVQSDIDMGHSVQSVVCDGGVRAEVSDGPSKGWKTIEFTGTAPGRDERILATAEVAISGLDEHYQIEITGEVGLND